MIRFYKEIYSDETTEPNISKISESILKKEHISSLYLIMLASNPCEQLDIYSYRMFKMALPHRKDTFIVGIASSRKSAMELICKMALDCYEKYNNYDFRKMFCDAYIQGE